MSDKVDIQDLGKKIELVLRSDRTKIRSKDALMKKLGLGKDSWSRIMSGTRVLTEDRFLQLCDAFEMKQKEWFNTLLDFGKQLGFTRKQISLLTNTPLPGIDFDSRIQEEKRIDHHFSVLEGYWESFYFSVSKLEKKMVSRDLVIFHRINEDRFIECEVDDSVSQYKGWCFPIQKQLYLMLEKQVLYNEIIVYATNLPDRRPPRLYGVILCLSGDVGDSMQAPCAAKVAFRYLARSAEIRRDRGLEESVDIDDLMRKSIPKYIDPLDPDLDKDTAEIIRDICNVLDVNAVPSALRLVK